MTEHLHASVTEDGAEALADAGPLDDLNEAVSAAAIRPADVPEKFWDATSGSLRTEALLKSYLQLEKKLGSMVALPNDEADEEAVKRLHRALGVPESPEEYQIEPSHPAVALEPEVKARLHQAGFTPRQVQLVADLAAEHLVPVVEHAMGDAQTRSDVGRLAEHFGSTEAWRALAPQIKTWAEANLAPQVYDTLATSYDGVIAMHQMMQMREPRLIQEAGAPTAGMQPEQLVQMMRDPRYWRDRDPDYVAQVTRGFKRLYEE